MKKTDVKKAIFLTGGAILAAAVTVIAVKNYFRPRPVWYVEDGYEKAWAGITGTNAGKGGIPEFKQIKTWRQGDKPRNREYGFIITTRLDDKRPHTGEPEELANAPTVFRQLSRNMAAGDAMLLAVDPWLIYQDQDDPPLTRERITSAQGGEGTIFLPGREKDVVRAWLAQFVMEARGIFPGDPSVWNAAETTLFDGRRFQQGAATFGWNDVWFYFHRRKPAWIYGPVSKIRAFPGHDTDRLTAARFPSLFESEDLGIQANLLWAVPFGNDKTRSMLEPLSAWLGAPETQTLIADTLGWVPAHREGKPFNILVYNAQLAWLTSSFVWQFQD
jgi:hypothetical protein